MSAEENSPSPIAEFDLPFPPSVNNLFSQTKAGRRYPSKRYRTWRRAAEWQLTAARVGKIDGPVSLVVELAPHDRRSRDADNFLKAVLDLLVANLVLEGDSQRYVHKVTSRWLEPSRPATARVSIYAAEK